MTAEIAIMNRTAIALAADSAVTIERKRGSQTVYNSENKLFMLSKYQPVALMIYQDAEIMGLPWETVIKMFRKDLGRESFPALENYATRFLSFLETRVFSRAEQDNHFKDIVGREFVWIRMEAERREKEVGQQAGIGDFIAKVTSERKTDLDSRPLLESFSSKFVDILGQYRGTVDELRKQVFEGIELTAECVESLYSIAVQFFNRDHFIERTGVVVAGFGVNDKYPAYLEYHIDCVVLSTLKYKQVSKHSVETGGACIAPFAQKSEVDAFICAIHPKFERFLLTSLADTILKRYPVQIAEIVGGDDARKQEVTRKLEQVGEGVRLEFEKWIKDYQREKHIRPIISTIEYLPKDELAIMAEALVNLTSFKKKVTMESPTVGGPIDVAVISKGDGFIWIKRKHYFKTELNPHFLRNYFELEDKGKEDKTDA